MKWNILIIYCIRLNYYWFCIYFLFVCCEIRHYMCDLYSFFKAKNQFNDSGIIDEEEGTCNNDSEVQTIKVDKLRMLESGFVSTLFLNFSGSSSIL